MTLLVPLFLLSSGTYYLKDFSAQQLQSVSYLAITTHGYGFAIGLIFFGFACLVRGYLIFRSGYFPKALGLMVLIAGMSYLVNSFTMLLAPSFAAAIFPGFSETTGTCICASNSAAQHHCVQNTEVSSASKHRLAFALMFITPALWAVNYLVARSAPGVIEPHALALLRWLIASLLFSLGQWGEIWEARAEIAGEWKRYLVLGALGMWICGAWVYIGGRTTAAINISLIYSIAPVLIVLAARLWLKERISLTQGIGVALALAGVLHVVLKGEWSRLGNVTLVPGDGWIFGATIAWAMYSLLLRRWPSRLNASARLALIAMAGVLVMLPFAIFEAVNNPLPVLTLNGIGLALAVAIFPGYGAYLAYSVMQRELGVARVGVVLYLGPIYAAVIAWLVLGEALHAYHAWAMAMVLPGVYLVNRKSGT